MPNWTYNTVKVKGKKDKIEAFLKRHFIRGQEGNIELDFNTVILRPESLGRTEAGSITHDARALMEGQVPKGINAQLLAMTDEQALEYEEMLRKYRGMGKEAQAYWDGTIEPFRNSVPPITDVAQYLEKLRAKKPRDSEMVELIQSNIREHGVPDWYEWSIRNWGVKWNAGQTSVEAVFVGDKGMLNIAFDTAWDIPHGIVTKLAEMYEKDLWFGWRAEFEGDDEVWSEELGSRKFNFRGLAGLEPITKLPGETADQPATATA